jgi:excisionase family DNA binding protein
MPALKNPSEKKSHPKPAFPAVLCSVNEAAYYLSISRSTLFKLIAERKIPTVKLGNRTFILYEILHQFARALPRGNHENPPTSAPAIPDECNVIPFPAGKSVKVKTQS